MNSNLASRIHRFLQREDGPTAVEYAVMLAVIASTIAVSVTLLGDGLKATFDFIASALTG